MDEDLGLQELDEQGLTVVTHTISCGPTVYIASVDKERGRTHKPGVAKTMSAGTRQLVSGAVAITLILGIAGVEVARRRRSRRETVHSVTVSIHEPGDLVGLPCAVLIPGEPVGSRYPDFEPYIYTGCICTNGTISDVVDGLPEHDLDWMFGIMMIGPLEYDSSNGPVYCLGNYLLSQMNTAQP